MDYLKLTPGESREVSDELTVERSRLEPDKYIINGEMNLTKNQLMQIRKLME